jgi:hypothetical protein
LKCKNILYYISVCNKAYLIIKAAAAFRFKNIIYYTIFKFLESKEMSAKEKN